MTLFEVEASVKSVAIIISIHMLNYEMHRRNPLSRTRGTIEIDLDKSVKETKDFLAKEIGVELNEKVFKDMILDYYNKNLLYEYLHQN